MHGQFSGIGGPLETGQSIPFVNQQRVAYEIDKSGERENVFVAASTMLFEQIVEKWFVHNVRKDRQATLSQRQPPQHFHLKTIHGKLLFGTNAAKVSAQSGVNLHKDVESGAAKADPTDFESPPTSPDEGSGRRK
jgi:hypothetical protein